MNVPIVYTFLFAMLALRVSSLDNSGKYNISGQTLYNVGKHYNMSLVSIIGKAMKNIESDVREVAEEMCRLHRCSEWTNWSNCDVRADKQRLVGVQTRSRTCGENTTMCERYGLSRTVLDYKVCESGFGCPKEYKFTTNGFCLRYYTSPKSWDNAEAVCRSDGGHLVRVDSELKAKDINETVLALPPSISWLWIDGRRSVQAGPWSYGYKSTDSNFTYWGDNDPDNGATELCMMYHKSEKTKFLWRWFDYPCNNSFHFICQILA
ncbi:C-type lectin mannose-binding isoform-like [Ruditapes philippinarum]|uniref:C-type lectin mannose-binding isoform-like n=1 Tax=Ruditapes philippinarum TaxID=129788 RepID=UPI00295AFC1C|nr:C-type lectin mannose-binding isoform-like [Ruditapes philippinarum]